MVLYYSAPNNNIKIYNDDYLKAKFDDKADLIVTSPPYNVDIKYENYNCLLYTSPSPRDS